MIKHLPIFFLQNANLTPKKKSLLVNKQRKIPCPHCRREGFRLRPATQRDKVRSYDDSPSTKAALARICEGYASPQGESGKTISSKQCVQDASHSPLMEMEIENSSVGGASKNNSCTQFNCSVISSERKRPNSAPNSSIAYQGMQEISTMKRHSTRIPSFRSSSPVIPAQSDSIENLPKLCTNRLEDSRPISAQSCPVYSCSVSSSKLKTNSSNRVPLMQLNYQNTR